MRTQPCATTLLQHPDWLPPLNEQRRTVWCCCRLDQSDPNRPSPPVRPSYVKAGSRCSTPMLWRSPVETSTSKAWVPVEIGCSARTPPYAPLGELWADLEGLYQLSGASGYIIPGAAAVGEFSMVSIVCRPEAGVSVSLCEALATQCQLCLEALVASLVYTTATTMRWRLLSPASSTNRTWPRHWIAELPGRSPTSL